MTRRPGRSFALLVGIGAGLELGGAGLAFFGLETMAQGGVAVVGETGEYYARHLDNAFVVNSGEPDEIVHHLKTAISRPDLVAQIRKGGEISAKRYDWSHILELWADRVSYVTGQP